MRDVLARRLATLPPTLFIVSVIVFSVTMILPGDPALAILGEDATVAQLEALRRELGLDRPLVVQYGTWLGSVVRGDLGRSLRYRRPVLTMILERLPVTVQLTLAAMVLAIVVGVPTGIIAATRHNSAWDVGGTVTAMVGVALPTYWLGILLILVFAVHLRLLPPSGFVPFWVDPIANFRSLLLPALAASTMTMAIIMRQTRSAMLEIIREDYVRTARAKGLRDHVVNYRHALRNALIPVVTVIGLQLGVLLGGAVVTETIFSLPGTGRLLVDAIHNRDFPLAQGLILFAAVAVLLANLLVDLLYYLIDPRIRTQ